VTFEAVYVDPAGRTARSAYAAALAVLLAAVAFYYFLVPGRTGQFALLMLRYPALVLHARRLHAMARSAWPVLVPGVLLAATAWLHLAPPAGAPAQPITWAAVAASALFVLWGLLGRDRPAT
jgi:uncharacterized membrane protein YhaH (DUF805 family)